MRPGLAHFFNTSTNALANLINALLMIVVYGSKVEL